MALDGRLTDRLHGFTRLAGQLVQGELDLGWPSLDDAPDGLRQTARSLIGVLRGDRPVGEQVLVGLELHRRPDAWRIHSGTTSCADVKTVVKAACEG